MDFVIGVVSGLACLAVYWRFDRQALAQTGVVLLGIILGIYVGAHLVTSDLPRLLMEAGVATVALVLAMLFQRKWPMGIGLLILAHGGYDLVFGHGSGVADWYPGLCVGFDVVVGIGLSYRLGPGARPAPEHP